MMANIVRSILNESMKETELRKIKFEHIYTVITQPAINDHFLIIKTKQYDSLSITIAECTSRYS